MTDERELKKTGLSDEFIEKAVTEAQVNPFASHNLFKASSKADSILDFYLNRETDSEKRKKLKNLIKQSDLVWIKTGAAEMLFLTEVGPEIWRQIVREEKVEMGKEELIQEINKELGESYRSMKKLLMDIHEYIMNKMNEEE